jgi:hypothetical protein
VPRQALFVEEESLEELLELFPPQATNPVAKAKIKNAFFIFRVEIIDQMKTTLNSNFYLKLMC